MPNRLSHLSTTSSVRRPAATKSGGRERQAASYAYWPARQALPSLPCLCWKFTHSAAVSWRCLSSAVQTYAVLCHRTLNFLLSALFFSVYSQRYLIARHAQRNACAGGIWRRMEAVA